MAHGQSAPDEQKLVQILAHMRSRRPRKRVWQGLVLLSFAMVFNGTIIEKRSADWIEFIVSSVVLWWVIVGVYRFIGFRLIYGLPYDKQLAEIAQEHGI